MHESCMSTGIRGLLSQISNTDCKGSVGLESVFVVCHPMPNLQFQMISHNVATILNSKIKRVKACPIPSGFFAVPLLTTAPPPPDAETATAAAAPTPIPAPTHTPAPTMSAVVAVMTTNSKTRHNGAVSNSS